MSAHRTPLPVVLRDIGPTSARPDERTAAHPGSLALNIPYPRFWSSGDWHEHSAWFGAESDQVSEYSLASEQHGPLLDKLGNSGLTASEGAWRRWVIPPRGRADVFGRRTHERAVLEWCWSRIDEHTRAGLPDSGNRLIGALRELGFKVDDELAEEIGRGRNFIQADRRTVWTASRCARSTTSSREQEAVGPGKGPGVASAAGGHRPLPQARGATGD